ncbi:hypothetical protein [Bacillus cereus]|uniref:hypothetical protein n=1 Tax=Bacillus cereus TaxID=1396 RepID=UPI00130415A4|nr:hypothetical protein [Bacillus cereus]
MKKTNTTLKLNQKVVKLSIKELKAENNRLYMEIDYLKNLKILVEQMKNLQ